MSDLTITDTKEVWVVYTNTDLTEGRGYQYPIHVCGSASTAARMAICKGVQGSDANVSKEIAVKVRGSWLAPVSIIEPNDADRRADELNAERLRVMDKARAAGLQAQPDADWTEATTIPTEQDYREPLAGQVPALVKVRTITESQEFELTAVLQSIANGFSDDPAHDAAAMLKRIAGEVPWTGDSFQLPPRQVGLPCNQQPSLAGQVFAGLSAATALSGLDASSAADVVQLMLDAAEAKGGEPCDSASPSSSPD